MASRLATAGLLRDAPLPLLPRRPVPRVRQQRRGHARPSGADGHRHADQHRRRRARRCWRWPTPIPAARDGTVGVVGFCMSGGLAVVARPRPARTRRAPRRRSTVRGSCATRDDSPHLGLDPVQAELYFAWVDGDPTAPPETVPVMTAALDAAGVTYTIDTITERRARLRPGRPALRPGGLGAALGARPRTPAPQRRLTLPQPFDPARQPVVKSSFASRFLSACAPFFRRKRQSERSTHLGT